MYSKVLSYGLIAIHSRQDKILRFYIILRFLSNVWSIASPSIETVEKVLQTQYLFVEKSALEYSENV